MSEHADAVLAATENGGATSSIAASWRRCSATHHLDPDHRRMPERDTNGLREAEERDAKLIAIAAPYLDQLFEAIADPDGSTALGDRYGMAIKMRYANTQDMHEQRPWRLLGVLATEAALGTNGNGTCLVEERPVAICGADHFLSSLTGMACFAAPIFGPEGDLVGCLNATATEPRGQQIRTFAQMAVRSFAQCIEIELFAASFPDQRLMLASYGGHNPASLLSVDRYGVILGATRAARRLLSLDVNVLKRGVDLETLRGREPPEKLAEAERQLIIRSLALHGGNVSRAAKYLGISRSTLYRKTPRN